MFGENAFRKTNDPVADSVKKIMEDSNLHREVVDFVNKSLGIEAKKALPYSLHEDYETIVKSVYNEAIMKQVPYDSKTAHETLHKQPHHDFKQGAFHTPGTEEAFKKVMAFLKSCGFSVPKDNLTESKKKNFLENSSQLEEGMVPDASGPIPSNNWLKAYSDKKEKQAASDELYKKQSNNKIEEEQLDEISKTLAKRYIKKSSRDLKKRSYEKGRSDEYDEQRSVYDDSDDYRTSAKKKINNRKHGIDRAVDKLEEEQLDELTSKGKGLNNVVKFWKGQKKSLKDKYFSGGRKKEPSDRDVKQFRVAATSVERGEHLKGVRDWKKKAKKHRDFYQDAAKNKGISGFAGRVPIGEEEEYLNAILESAIAEGMTDQEIISLFENNEIEQLDEISKKKAYGAYSDAYDSEHEKEGKIERHIERKWGKKGGEEAYRHAYAQKYGRDSGKKYKTAYRAVEEESLNELHGKGSLEKTSQHWKDRLHSLNKNFFPQHSFGGDQPKEKEFKQYNLAQTKIPRADFLKGVRDWKKTAHELRNKVKNRKALEEDHWMDELEAILENAYEHGLTDNDILEVLDETGVTDEILENELKEWSGPVGSAVGWGVSKLSGYNPNAPVGTQGGMSWGKTKTSFDRMRQMKPTEPVGGPTNQGGNAPGQTNMINPSNAGGTVGGSPIKPTTEPKQSTSTPTPSKTVSNVKDTNKKGYFTGKSNSSSDAYTIKKGETLSSIAKANRLKVSDIQAMNKGITDVNKIAAGGKLNLTKPTSSSDTGSSTPTPSTPAPKINPSNAGPAGTSFSTKAPEPQNPDQEKTKLKAPTTMINPSNAGGSVGGGSITPQPRPTADVPTPPTRPKDLEKQIKEDVQPVNYKII